MQFTITVANEISLSLFPKAFYIMIKSMQDKKLSVGTNLWKVLFSDSMLHNTIFVIYKENAHKEVYFTNINRIKITQNFLYCV